MFGLRYETNQQLGFSDSQEKSLTTTEGAQL